MKKILILTTGGTLDKIYFDAKSQHQVGDPVVESILREMNVAFDIEVIEICRKDSLEIDAQDRAKLKAHIDASSVTSIMVTHGTDTMAESALLMGDYNDKVIVFTGAMHPAVFKETDAVFNIGTAIGVLNCAMPGVYVVMNGKVFSPKNVVKNYQTKVFEEA